MTDEQDPVVAAAIRSVPVPPHGPGFWDELDARLAAEDAPAPVAPTPAPVADVRVATGELPSVSVLRPAPPAPAAHRLRFAVAAAVVAVLALGAGLVLRGDGSDDPGTTEQAGDPGVTTTLGTFGFGSPAESSAITPPETTMPPSVDLTGASEVVVEWVGHLGIGDEDAAAALLGPRSLAWLDSLGADPPGYMQELMEGYGAWAAVPDAVRATVEVPGAGAVVVLQGEPRREGSEGGVQYEAIPVVQAADGSWLVEPAAFDPDTGGRLELVVPPPGEGGWASLLPGELVEAATEDPEATVWFSLDGAPAVPTPSGQWEPPGPRVAGEHLLVVVAVGDATFTALAGVLGIAE